MTFRKTHEFVLPCCYAVATLEAGERRYHLYATDDHGPCWALDAETLERELVWEGPGGTMSMVPLPGTDGEFLASQCFLPGFRARDARIVRVRREGGRWRVEPWMELPYVHRFDVIESGGRRYLLACILSDTGAEQADWEAPGFLAAAPLEAGYPPPAALERIAGGMSRNHGYWLQQEQGLPAAYTACDQGVFRVRPPRGNGGWQVERLLEAPCSDLALCDIDGDGLLEMATIQPFHGEQFVVYKQEGAAWRERYRCPEPMAFLHAIWGGTLRGEPVFLGGCRELGKVLFLLRWRNGAIRREIIETGMGPSNITVLPGRDVDWMLVANREGAQAALFAVGDN